ncbi:hypothetical protein MGL_3806 [Malassezia globosa CBS 7966]|uniref:Metallo-beta-lactamase domain-containing protein n=1 Tax=Malassezia globosa (strain ATCC MYA-4612 / CBS 7966) TaxID=425265 RepID=A8QAP8_MALGO|nr:uncharacterized protein MGL_3806 [Malassezia globosa CBS 7966]EDP41804.1 hypothetical protein MGL_3806 [Malassezia globosa CBS 7966]
MDVTGVLQRLIVRPSRTIGWLVGVWAGAWCTYYALQEIKRGLVLSSRRKKYPLKQRKGERLVSDKDWYGEADEAERQNIVARFGVMRFAGRYLNVTAEWREQGAWEWIWWKVVHSMIWNRGFGFDGGFTHDLKSPGGLARIESILPVEPLDIGRLWGQDTNEPAAPRTGVSYTWLGTKHMPYPVTRSHNLDRSCLWRSACGQCVESMAYAAYAMQAARLENGVSCERVHELSWWDEWRQPCHVRVRGEAGATSEASTVEKRELEVAAVPASHWSARTLLDTNRSLWNSYAVRCAAQDKQAATLFFCGDSGYSPLLFSSIGRMYGPFDVASIPIGSYEPRWHLSLQHMDPHGAVCVARDVGARQSFGMHWGTWCMSDERWDAPPRDLPASAC